MKHATQVWYKEAKAAGIKFTPRNLVHDEWQTSVYNMEDAHELGRIQRESITQVGKDLGILCPLAGTTKIGTNWAEAH